MTIAYAVHSLTLKFDEEFADLYEAVDKAETFGEAELIVWAVNPNLPGLKPDLVYNSCALYTWRNREWRCHSIHGYESGSWVESPRDRRSRI